MSCLMLSELPLPEQIAIELASAARVRARVLALFPFLDSPASPAASSSPCGAMGMPASPPCSTEHEGRDMIEKQITDHPPLLACYPGHRPRMYQATGDLATVYYVECSLCGVRSPRFPAPDDAAHAWARRDVMPIHVNVRAVA